MSVLLFIRGITIVASAIVAGASLAALVAYLIILWHSPETLPRSEPLIVLPAKLGAVVGGSVAILTALIRR